MSKYLQKRRYPFLNIEVPSLVSKSSQIMKRSKIFLGITTCILAIVGVAATKAHKFTNTKTGFFGTRSNTCAHVSQEWYTQGTIQCTVQYNGGIYLVWTRNSKVQTCSNVPLQHKLFKDHIDGD
jgi:hypothetical protein